MKYVIDSFVDDVINVIEWQSIDNDSMDEVTEYQHPVLMEGFIKPLSSSKYHYYKREETIFKVLKDSPFGCTVLEPLDFCDAPYCLGEMKDISFIVEDIQKWLSYNGKQVDVFSEFEDEFEEIQERYTNFI
jgi:hypothetical protein